MNKRIKKLWVAALRSGKYKQTTGTLHEAGGGYCCLGVLCNIYNREKGHGGVKSGNFLPESVQKWAKLNSFNPYVGTNYASYLNDTANLNFNQIADEIERYL